MQGGLSVEYLLHTNNPHGVPWRAPHCGGLPEATCLIPYTCELRDSGCGAVPVHCAELLYAGVRVGGPQEQGVSCMSTEPPGLCGLWHAYDVELQAQRPRVCAFPEQSVLCARPCFPGMLIQQEKELPSESNACRLRSRDRHYAYAKDMKNEKERAECREALGQARRKCGRVRTPDTDADARNNMDAGDEDSAEDMQAVDEDSAEDTKTGDEDSVDDRDFAEDMDLEEEMHAAQDTETEAMHAHDLTDYRQELTQAIAECDRLRGENANAEKEHAQALAKCQQQHTETEAMHAHDLTQAIAECDRLRGENANAEKEHAQALAKCQQQHTENVDAEKEQALADCERLRVMNINSRKEVVGARQECDRLRMEKSDANNKLEKTLRELENAQYAYKHMISEYQKKDVDYKEIELILEENRRLQKQLQ